MYEAQFLVPEDYENTSSEQFLGVYRGQFEEDADLQIGLRRFGSLAYLMQQLGLVAELPKSESHFQDIQLGLIDDDNGEKISDVVKIFDNNAWPKTVVDILNAPATSIEMNLDFVSQTWCRIDVQDEVYVATGERRWLLIHWFSTA
ncbi:hypothetical protein ACI3L1_03910 [Deinococcus sp. SM5_A1]|uniref:hypothetical protein n=1 Tax=Deinococcus sp. SM5_A1 TaxID=3379094 RepID=UPI00385A0ABD